MYKYLKLLMITMIATITNSTVNLFTADIANQRSAKNLTIENDLGKIDDLKKETIENAIKKKLLIDNKLVLVVKFINIDFKQATVSVIWKDLKFPNRKNSKEKIILYYFQPQLIRLSDIITSHDVKLLKIVQKYHNFEKYDGFRDDYIMAKLKRKTPLYDNAIWDNIKVVHYVNNHDPTEKNQYYNNFQAYLRWKFPPETNREAEYEKLCFDPKWLKINYALKRIKLSKDIVKNINLQEIKIVTPGHILEKFQRLNPDLDAINLKVSNIEITDNGFGSAIISSHDQNKIIPGYNCYDDKLIKISFFTKNKQVITTSNGDLQTIYTIDPNDIVKQFKKQYPVVEIDLKFFTMEYIDEDDVTAILISPFVKKHDLGTSIYDVNKKLKKGFFRQKTKFTKIVCNSDLREITKLNQYHILERFAELNPDINPINLEVVDIKISADRLHGTAIIRNRFFPWPEYQIYNGAVNVTFSLRRMPLVAHNNTNNYLKKIITADSEHILERFIELNPDIDGTDLKVSNIEINNNGIGSAIISSHDHNKTIVANKFYNDTFIKVNFFTNNEQSYYDNDAGLKTIYYYHEYDILKQFEEEHPEHNTYLYTLRVAFYNKDIGRGVALITSQYAASHHFIYDDNVDYLKPNFFFQEFKLKNTFYNSNLKEIDKSDKSYILERFLKLNPHIDPTNLEVDDINISPDNEGTATIKKKDVLTWKGHVYRGDIKLTFSMSKAGPTFYIPKHIRTCWG